MRILVVDDAPALRAIFWHIADALGHAVVGEASNLERALTLARALCPEAVVLDGRLGGADLARALPALRDAARPAPAVLVVAALEEATIVRVARDGGAAGLVRRPFSRSQVREALNACRVCARGGAG